MKLLITSDTHLEFHIDPKIFLDSLCKHDVDIIVIAGDFDTAETLIITLDYLCKITKTPILFVAGNHEYYHSDRATVSTILEHIQRTHEHFHWLNNTEVTILGQSFVGTTLWFQNNLSTAIHSVNFNDFHQIKDFRKWVYEENEKSVDFLNKNIHGESIVITHHAPSEKSMQTGYNDSLSCFFYTDMERLISEVQPRVWIYGHTHYNLDYNIGRTRIICTISRSTRTNSTTRVGSI